MRQKALLTPEEEAILKSLIGKPIKGLVAGLYGYGQFDGLYLSSEDAVVVFAGLEVSAPTPMQTIDEVGRIWVGRSSAEKAQQVKDYEALKIGYFGDIQRIWRVRTVISFEYLRREKSRTTASGEVRPGGEIYAAAPILHHPTQVTQDTEEWVDTDLGVVLQTDTHRILAYNEGNSIWLAIRFDDDEELPEELRDAAVLIPLAPT